jgi:predicted HTH transcriptional regulator
MPMTWNEIIELLNQGEGQSVEFDKVIPSPDDIAREYVAFANSDGGRIIYGIDDKNKHLMGVDIEDNTADKLIDIGKTKCVPPVTPTIEVFDQGGKKLIVINVNEGDEKPYRTDDICYIRDGNISRPAREKEEEEIKSPWAGKDLNKRQKRAIQFISEHGLITNREYREAFNVSHKTAHIELTMLVDKKILDSQGAGRNTHYVLPPM